MTQMGHEYGDSPVAEAVAGRCQIKRGDAGDSVPLLDGFTKGVSRVSTDATGTAKQHHTHAEHCDRGRLGGVELLQVDRGGLAGIEGEVPL